MPPTSVPLRNGIKGVACAQTPVPFRNVEEKPSCVHLHKFIVPSAIIVVLVVNVAMSKRKNNCDESKEERVRRLTKKTEAKTKIQNAV